MTTKAPTLAELRRLAQKAWPQYERRTWTVEVARELGRWSGYITAERYSERCLLVRACRSPAHVRRALAAALRVLAK